MRILTKLEKKNVFVLNHISKSDLIFELSQYIKHKVNMDDSKEPGPYGIEGLEEFEPDPEIRVAMPKIINSLNELLELWKLTCKKNNFKEYKAFGEKIKGLGELYSMSVLSKYGDCILAGVAGFKIKKIKLLMEAYPVLIDKLKKCGVVKS